MATIQANNLVFTRRPGNILLMDLPQSIPELIQNLATTKILCNKYNLQPVAYGANIPFAMKTLCRPAALLHSILYKQARLSRKIGIPMGLDFTFVENRHLNRAYALYESEIFLAKPSKDEIISYRYNGVCIGKAAYDTALKTYQVPTVSCQDARLALCLKQAFLVYCLSEEFFNTHTVKAIVLGHCVYNNWGIISDMALQRGIEVFVTYNSPAPPLHHVNSQRGLQTVDHNTYPLIFSKLPQSEQSTALESAKSFIEKSINAI
jgi:hypothetical protein